MGSLCVCVYQEWRRNINEEAILIQDVDKG